MYASPLVHVCPLSAETAHAGAELDPSYGTTHKYPVDLAAFHRGDDKRLR
jgi:hypothetical protein